MQRLHYIFHFIIYYISWLICIALAAKNHPWLASAFVLVAAGAQVLWQKWMMRDCKNLYLLIIILTILGTTIDTLYLQSGLVIFNANPFAPYISPPWMISIWISFAVSFFATLKGLFNRYIILGFLALPGFAFAYYVGVYMGAATFTHGNLTSLAIGLTWLFLLPLSLRLYNLIVNIHA